MPRRKSKAQSSYPFQETWNNDATALVFKVDNNKVNGKPKMVLVDDALRLLKEDQECLLAFGMHNDTNVALMASIFGLFPPGATNYVIWPTAHPSAQAAAKYCPERVMFDPYKETDATPIIEVGDPFDDEGKKAAVFDRISDRAKPLMNRIMVAVSIMMCANYGKGVNAGVNSLELICDILQTQGLITAIAESINAPVPEELGFNLTREQLRPIVQTSIVTRYVNGGNFCEQCYTCAAKTSSPLYDCARIWADIEHIVEVCAQDEHRHRGIWLDSLENVNLLRFDSPQKFAEAMDTIGATSSIEALLMGVPIDDILV